MSKMGRPRKYKPEEAKAQYELQRKKKLEALTEEEKVLRRLRLNELGKKSRERNKEKTKARYKERMLDPEYRKKQIEHSKKQKKRSKEKDPLFDMGKNIKNSARNRNLEAPHAPLEYKNWYIAQVKKCYFCGNDNETIKRYLEKIGEKITKQQNRLGFDRLDSSKGYLLNNLALACSICNSHKSDIVSAEDFREIARDYIAPKIKRTV